MAQRVKRLPAMWETWVQSLGRKDLLEKEMAIHSGSLAWKIPWTEEPATVHGVAKGQTRLSDFTHSLTHSLTHSCPGLDGAVEGENVKRRDLSYTICYFKSKRLNTVKLKISPKLINNFKEIQNKIKII